MRTHCRTVQLLEPIPYPDLEVINPSASLATEEGGALALTQGVTQYTVLFTVPKVNSDYDFIESDIANDVDGSPLSIEPAMSNRSTTGFTLTLDSQPDSSHYVFRYRVRVTSI